MNKPFIICLMGPTASGKTDLAVQLVQQLPCSIISVDSALVYKGMDIGTAKPDSITLAKAPHRLLDICDITTPYSAANFCIDAMREINSIINQGQIPLLVGGTMLYFRALQQGLAELPSADQNIRTRLEEEGKILGWNKLHERLQRIDPEAAKRIHQHDTQRIQRALEVYEITGYPITQYWQASIQSQPYRVLNLAIAPSDRVVLHQRIAQRLSMMWKKGFVDEVRKFYLRSDCHPPPAAMRAVGYRQVWQYLAGELIEEQMQEKALIATRQFAKRQLTWLRNWRDITWLDTAASDNLVNAVTLIRSVSC